MPLANIESIKFATTGDCLIQAGNYTIYTGADVDCDTGAPLPEFMYAIEWVDPAGKGSELMEVVCGFETQVEMIAATRKKLTEIVAEYGE